MWDPFGSAMIMELGQALGEDGKIKAWKSERLDGLSHQHAANDILARFWTLRYLENAIELTSGEGIWLGGHRNR